jgi:hypothetical protein
MDVAHTEAVEAELARFIEKRSQKGETNEDEQHDLWRASMKAYQERERRGRAVAWWGFETRLARLHAQLASEHESKAREWGELVEQMDKVEENGHRDD